MNLEYYRTFYQVVLDGSITKAAKSLFVSQPAVSKTIKILEEELACPLFIRTSTGVQLTREGESLFKQIQIAFDHIQAGENILRKHIDHHVGHVKVGISHTLCKYIFMPLIKQFHEQHPHVQIEVVNSPSKDTYQMLKQGALDFGITTMIPDQPLLDHLVRRPFMVIEDIVVTNDSKSPLVGDHIGLQMLHNYPLLMLEKGNSTRHYIDQFLKAHTLSLEPDIEIGSMEFLIEFAKIGMGQAFVIRNFVEEALADESLIELQTFPKIPLRDVAIVTLSDVPISIASGLFIDFILEAYQPEPLKLV